VVKKTEKSKNYKYQIMLKWPAVCRNRSPETLQERPDLALQMNNFRIKLDNVCKLILRKGYRVDESHNIGGLNIWMESGQDLYDFIIRQPEFDWEIVPEIGTVNSLTGEYRKWQLIYMPTGISVA